MKIIPCDQVSDQDKSLMESMHKLGDESFEQIWNHSIKILNNHCPMTGDMALSALTTYIAHYVSLWVVNMKKINENDESYYDLETLTNNVFEAVAKVLSFKKKEFPNGIKRIKNDMGQS